MTAEQGRRERWVAEALERYEVPLVRYALRLTGDLDSARDVVQDTFLKLWTADMERLGENFAPWLYTVCRNRALDVIRKERRMIAWRDGPGGAGGSPSPTAVRGAAELGVAAHEILTALAALPARQQEVVRLKFLDGLTYGQISEITGTPVGTVGYLIHITLAELRRALAAHPETAAAREGGAQ